MGEVSLPVSLCFKITELSGRSTTEAVPNITQREPGALWESEKKERKKAGVGGEGALNLRQESQEGDRAGGHKGSSNNKS